MSGILNVESLLVAYANGFFPMADEFDGEIYWHCPDPRAIFPIRRVKPSRSLRQFLKKSDYYCKIDSNFEAVIKNCANRPSTWINEEIIKAFIELHKVGFAHSVETYENGVLIGGLYGVSIGGAFFGESMFSVKTNASKTAFFHLIERLKRKNFILLDSQYINDFTERLGAIQVKKETYMRLLKAALVYPASF